MKLHRNLKQAEGAGAEVRIGEFRTRLWTGMAVRAMGLFIACCGGSAGLSVLGVELSAPFAPQAFGSGRAIGAVAMLGAGLFLMTFGAKVARVLAPKCRAAHCARCGYALDEEVDRCSECGLVSPAPEGCADELAETLRARRVVGGVIPPLAAVLLVLGLMPLLCTGTTKPVEAFSDWLAFMQPFPAMVLFGVSLISAPQGLVRWLLPLADMKEPSASAGGWMRWVLAGRLARA